MSKTYWLDKLSKDKHGWMNAVPVQDSDDDNYKNWIKVVEFSEFEKLKTAFKRCLAQRNELIEGMPSEAVETFEEYLK